MPRDELPAVVAGREHDSAPPHSRMLPDLELDAVAQGSEAARLDDARRARMEMPPSIPRCGLKVFSARETPSGTEIVTAIFPEKPCAAHTSRTAEVIIARGVALMAAAPTGCSSPGNVTRPTPTPPSTETSDSRAGTSLPPAAPVPDPACSTRAYTSTPSVTSASSPASFRTAHWAHPRRCMRRSRSPRRAARRGDDRHEADRLS